VAERERGREGLHFKGKSVAKTGEEGRVKFQMKGKKKVQVFVTMRQTERGGMQRTEYLNRKKVALSAGEKRGRESEKKRQRGGKRHFQRDCLEKGTIVRWGKLSKDEEDARPCSKGNEGGTESTLPKE